MWYEVVSVILLTVLALIAVAVVIELQIVSIKHHTNKLKETIKEAQDIINESERYQG